jgi:hypothetical protein
MNPLLRVTLACGLLSLAHSSAMAQRQPPACPLVETPTLYIVMVSARTGCPFSAVIQLTTIQTLVDGTHIQQNVEALVYRDSLGRIRYESYAPTETAPSMIEISDPVEGFSYIILPRKAAIASRHKLGQSAANAKVGVHDQHITAPEPQISAETLGLSSWKVFWRPERDALGRLRQMRKEMTALPQCWSSTDMGITLLETTSDPRKGDSERRMTNLEQTEPDPSSISSASRLHDRGSISCSAQPLASSDVSTGFASRRRSTPRLARCANRAKLVSARGDLRKMQC